jgi:hypothetical protein
MLESELTEADFLCPYSKTRMDVPMMHKGCKHHVAKASLAQMLRNSGNTAKCPLPGCRAIWNNQAVVDEDFQYLMQNFYKKMSRSNIIEPENTIPIDDEEYDEYTQL